MITLLALIGGVSIVTWAFRLGWKGGRRNEAVRKYIHMMRDKEGGPPP